MEVITELNNFTPPACAVVTQGTFDGIHTGHQKILGEIVQLGKAQSGKSILVTFHPHPRMVINKGGNTIKLLTPFNEKIELLAAIGLDFLIVLPFDETVAKMPAFNFVRDILIEKIGMSTMVVGYDHRFGQNREGSFSDLKEYSTIFGFKVIEISAHDINQSSVSSTKIRKCLLSGDINTANLFLGRQYAIHGKVIQGRKMGKSLGFPTANIEIDDLEKLIPANGIYVVKVIHHQKVYGGMCSIGNNPTIANANWSIEVNIFDFNNNIYGNQITICFVSKMRDEKKFKNIDDLKIQLGLDEEEATRILKN